MTKNILLRIGKISLIIIAVLAVLFSAFFVWLRSIEWKDYQDDLEIQSPNGEYTLIIKEWSFLLAGGAEIYCSKNGGKAQMLGGVSSDDAAQPFYNGYDTVEWEENTVLIRYCSGTPAEHINKPDTWRSVRYELP